MDVSYFSKVAKVMPKNVFAEVPETYTLSEAQHKFYADNGYLVIKELIDFTTLYGCKQRFVQICKGIVDKGNMIVMKELSLMDSGAKGEDLINKVQDILYDEVFSTYCENPRLLHVLAQLIGPNIRAMHSMFINKPAGTGRHPPHQDLYYFPFRPADKIVASWTAVDDAHEDNGCLYVVPRSHTAGTLYPHGNLSGTNKFYHGIMEEATVAPPSARVPLEMSPGDTVLFHPLLVHGSGPNVSKRHRKSISCHYASSECDYIDVANTVQEGIATEVEQRVRNMGFNASYTDVWRAKSKRVMGVKCNL